MIAWPRSENTSNHRFKRALGVVVALVVLLWSPVAPAPAEADTASPTVQFTQVAVGAWGCGLNLAGDASCWGMSHVPAEIAGPFRSISVGIGYCGLKEDQTVVCDGAPPEAGQFLAVDAGCGVQVDGDLSCWPAAQYDPIVGPFTGLSVGYRHVCGLRADRDIECFGSDWAGHVPEVITGPFTAVSSGAGHACGLRADGDVACWGDNEYGQAPAKVTGPFTAVDAARESTCAIRSNGNLACWGRNLAGEAPENVLGPFVSISASNEGYATCAIRPSKTMTCWGAAHWMPSPPIPPDPDQPLIGTVGEPLPQMFPSANGTTAVYSARGLPSGVQMSKTGELIGIPRDVGVFPVKVTVENVFGSATSEPRLEVRRTPGFDANGDGRPDLVVGSPGEDVGTIRDAGSITILMGGADGRYATPSAVRLDQEDIGRTSEPGDRFGAALTLAEVTGDGYVDLIVSAPGEDNRAGQVVIVHGSARGIASTPRTVLRQGRNNAAGTAEAGDEFGAALSVADALWVGAPGEDLGRATDAGVVTKFPIKPVRPSQSVQLRQGAGGVPGAPERGDRFGAALAGGGTVIGAPGEDVGSIVNAGLVTWKLTTALSQNSPGVPGTAERGDRLGAAVAARLVIGRLEDEGDSDRTLTVAAIGAPGEDIGTTKDAGAVLVIRDDYEGRTQSFQALGPATGTARSGDTFGAALSYSTTGASLLVGVPGKDVAGLVDVGAVRVFPLGFDCASWCGDGYIQPNNGTTLVQGRGGIPGTPATGDRFGATVGPVNGVHRGVLIGAPGSNVSGHSDAGAIVIITPAPIAAEQIHQDSQDVPGSAETGDRFGTVPNN